MNSKNQLEFSKCKQRFVFKVPITNVLFLFDSVCDMSESVADWTSDNCKFDP